MRTSIVSQESTHIDLHVKTFRSQALFVFLNEPQAVLMVRPLLSNARIPRSLSLRASAANFLSRFCFTFFLAIARHDSLIDCCSTTTPVSNSLSVSVSVCLCVLQNTSSKNTHVHAHALGRLKPLAPMQISRSSFVFPPSFAYPSLLQPKRARNNLLHTLSLSLFSFLLFLHKCQAADIWTLSNVIYLNPNSIV